MVFSIISLKRNFTKFSDCHVDKGFGSVETSMAFSWKDVASLMEISLALPMKSSAKDIRNYGPISLVWCEHKLLSKMLPNLPKDRNPSPFVGVWYVLDAILINDVLILGLWLEGEGSIFSASFAFLIHGPWLASLRFPEDFGGVIICLIFFAFNDGDLYLRNLYDGHYGSQHGHWPYDCHFFVRIALIFSFWVWLSDMVFFLFDE